MRTRVRRDERGREMVRGKRVGVDGDLSVLGPLRQMEGGRTGGVYALAPDSLEHAMNDKPKTAFELAMERLNAEDNESGAKKEIPLTAKQKEAIAEARRIASSRLAEREILFRDAMKKTGAPEERKKAEEGYQIDLQRINDDRDRTIEAIRSRRD
jgi:hypothetical protein